MVANDGLLARPAHPRTRDPRAPLSTPPPPAPLVGRYMPCWHAAHTGMLAACGQVRYAGDSRYRSPHGAELSTLISPLTSLRYHKSDTHTVSH